MDGKTVLNGLNCCLINGDPECHQNIARGTIRITADDADRR